MQSRCLREDLKWNFNPSPESDIKPTALICTTHRRILASSSTNQRPEKGNLIPLRGVGSVGEGQGFGVQGAGCRVEGLGSREWRVGVRGERVWWSV